ncbi:MAG TPA: hypothetical protein VK125_04015 [Bacillota bacterium]|nr:hypothetical protein [Bacillota bacterium]
MKIIKNNNRLLAYFLIGLGVYFFIKKFNVPFGHIILSWPFIFFAIGIVFAIHSFRSRAYDHLLISFVLMGIGIHAYGLETYPFWIDHWAVFLLIIGIALILRSYWTKKGLGSGIIIIIFSTIFIFPLRLPSFLYWINDLSAFLYSLWPVLLISIGIYLLIKK